MLRTVTTELKRAGDVTSSSDAHSARVGGIVDPLLGLFLEEGQAITGTGDLQAGIAGWIRHEAALSETAEHTHLGELRTLSQFREQRDQEQEVLYRKALVMRVAIESRKRSRRRRSRRRRSRPSSLLLTNRDVLN